MAQTNTVTLNNVGIIFPNFAGRTDQYNKNGVRSFSVSISHETAEAMLADGFNVKFPKPNPEIDPDDDRRLPTLNITVSNDHDNIPYGVRIFLVDGETEQRIDNNNLDMFDMLDGLDIDYANVKFSIYDWSVNGNSGRKPYLQSLQIFLKDYSFGESTY